MMITKKTEGFAFMANRKLYWLASVVMVSVGLIFNIILGVRFDIQFTGGAVFCYSYPESGIVSGADVPAAALPQTPSDTEEQNDGADPAETPVIISDADASGSDVSQNGASGTDTAPGTSAGDTESASDLTVEGIQPDYSTAVSSDEAQRLIREALHENVTVSISTDAHSPTGGENKRLTVTFGEDSTVSENADEIIRAVLSEKYPNVVLSLRETNLVDPAVGSEFLRKCVMAVAVAALFMVLYIGFRFRQIGGWTAGVSALIAVVHDCLVVYFAFVVFRFSIDELFVAVVLAMIGHSLNSTIVIFDRMRENRRLLGDSVSLAELADKSINESLGRTVGTDLCVFIAMAVLAVVAAISGLPSILSFALPMMLGVAAGCYSSLCISGTIWVTWQEILERRRSAAQDDAG